MKNILVVDDFPSVRLYHCNLVHHLGYNAIPAASVAEAQSILAQQPIHLVLLDLLMPEGDGRELLQRQGPAGSIPYIVVTSESELYGASNLSQLQAYRVLNKPVTPRTLRVAIDSALAGAN